MRTVLSWVAAFVEAVPPSSPPLLLGAVPCVEVGCRLCGVSFRSARSVWEITLLSLKALGVCCQATRMELCVVICLSLFLVLFHLLCVCELYHRGSLPLCY